jgi:hypothetical protein
MYGYLWQMKKETRRYARLYNANWIKQIRAGKRGNTALIWIDPDYFKHVILYFKFMLVKHRDR